MKSSKLLNLLILTLLILGTLPLLATASPPEAQLTQTASPVAVPVAPNPEAVLWDQPTDYGQGGVAVDFPPEGWGAFSADDFENADLWAIDTIFVAGWIYYGSMYDATALHWCIYPDAGGAPVGHPYVGGEFWCWSTVPTDPAVTIGGDYGGDVTLDVVAGLGAPLEVPPGHWWLVFYPEFTSSVSDLYYWFFGTTTNLANAHLVDPMDYFGMGLTWWTPWSSLGVTYWDMAFRLEGTTTGPTLHVGDIRMKEKDFGFGRTALAVVPILDDSGAPVPGALVSGEWTLPNGSVVFRQEYTNPVSGYANFRQLALPSGTYQFCVTDVSLAGYVYDPSQNVETCDSIVMPGGPTLHVGDIRMRERDFGFGRTALAVVPILDDSGAPVPGALVSGEWTLPDGSVVSRQRYTNPEKGYANFRQLALPSGTYQFCVTDVSLAGYMYDPSQNVETCDSITFP